MIEFDVVGNPAAQGSKRHVGNGVMVESSKNLKPWRSAVAEKAREVIGQDGALTGPLRLTVRFRFPMPKSRSKKIRDIGYCSKITAPDLDKLVRAVGDALKEGGMIQDDALFWFITASKIETLGWTGVQIILLKEIDT